MLWQQPRAEHRAVGLSLAARTLTEPLRGCSRLCGQCTALGGWDGGGSGQGPLLDWQPGLAVRRLGCGLLDGQLGHSFPALHQGAAPSGRLHGVALLMAAL